MSVDSIIIKRQMKNGDMLYIKGEPATGMFLIQEGAIELLSAGDQGTSEVFKTIGVVQVVGEIV
jgi:CRP-like cAMP-binding protein